jgi:tRNA(fMet)-specific endonuclease VapC
LINTNVVSHIMLGRGEGLLSKLSRLLVGHAVLSSVTLAELEFGLHRKGQHERLKKALDQILLRMAVLPWNQEVATYYGAFCVTLEAKGINLSDFDMMFAAHAVAVNATLVSRDKAFAQVPKQSLKLAIW